MARQTRTDVEKERSRGRAMNRAGATGQVSDDWRMVTIKMTSLQAHQIAQGGKPDPAIQRQMRVAWHRGTPIER